MSGSVLDASGPFARGAGRRPRHRRDRDRCFDDVPQFRRSRGLVHQTGSHETYVRSLRARLVFPLVPFDDDLAIRAALLLPATRSAGLSLGDRACLALAERSGVPALTADTAWSGVAEAAGVVVTLIR